MNLSIIENALLTVGVPVCHYTADKKADKYIVWAEDGDGGSSHADNKVTIRVIEGTVDYFTRAQNDPNVDKIEAALNNGKIAWRLGSIQYEDETKFIHYEWIWKAVA